MENTQENIVAAPNGFDYSYVATGARIAVYDDLLSSPQIIEVSPAPTRDFIGTLSKEVYERAHALGGAIPFTAIKQVAENFIHANFEEMVVSILDDGNTIRFTDQGPGISDKEGALKPGFSSATEPMKEFIDGVGSGLPIVHEYLDVKNGRLILEDNLNGGSVITLSLNSRQSEIPSEKPQQDVSPIDEKNNFQKDSLDPLGLLTASLSKRGRDILPLFLEESLWGVQDVANELDLPASSTHAELRKLEEAGLIEHVGTKRMLSRLGSDAARYIAENK